MTKPASFFHNELKKVSLSDMQQILAKHAGKVSVSVQPQPQPPGTERPAEPPGPAPRGTLSWGTPVKTGEHSLTIESKCGRFTICRDDTGKRYYLAFKRSVPPFWPDKSMPIKDRVAKSREVLGRFDTAAEAKEVCERAAK